MPVKNSELQTRYCKPLGFTGEDATIAFKAWEHPLHVPVTYVQGETDGITTAAQAKQSYQRAARGFAQWVFVKDGGHQPLQGPLQSGYEPGLPTTVRKKFLTFAMQGREVPASLLEELSVATDLGWTASLRK